MLAGAQAILGAIGLGAGLYSGWKGVEGAQGVASKNVNATGALTDAEAGALVERGGGGAKGTLNISLLDELTANGVKFTPENVIATTRNFIGKVVFLETGNSKAGLQHIIKEHGSQFA